MARTLNLSASRASGPLVLNLAPGGLDRTVTLAGRTRPVTGSALLGIIITGAAVGVTRGCRGRLAGAYDPNLLSALHVVTATGWTDAARLAEAQPAPWLPAAGRLAVEAGLRWRIADRLTADAALGWRQAERLSASGVTGWTETLRQTADTTTHWLDAPRLTSDAALGWQQASPVNGSAETRYRAKMPLLAPSVASRWSDGYQVVTSVVSLAGDGGRLTREWATRWCDAGLAYNAWHPPWVPPPKPRPPSKPLALNLRHLRPPGPLVLNLGNDAAQWVIDDRRFYSVLNQCAVVRLPDRIALPVTEVTVSTDVESWGWSVSLTLRGLDGWTLCQPGANGLPREVEITINGTVWTALLDDRQLTRSFNSRQITAKGMSRSGWLGAPFAPSSTVSYAVPRSAQQIAEEVLDGTGWALDWQLPADPDWLVPAGSYQATGTPLERLLALIAPVKSCLYSDPAGYGFIAYPRYPVPPWQWATAAPDVSIPEAALVIWTQQSADRSPLNRVYVSGTTAGVLLQLTLAGTAGDLQPTTPVVDPLLTDSYAARARALYELSQSGPGDEVTVETLLGGSAAIPLIRPGLLCEFAGLRGLVRSCSITARRVDDKLKVFQSLKLERRTGPWQ